MNRFFLIILFFAVGLTRGFAQVPGDNFSDAVVVSGLSGAITGTNVDATSESGEPLHAETITGHSVWFQWTAPVTGSIEFDTAGSTFDTVLAVYTGTVLTNLSVVATNNDVTSSNVTSRLVFRADAGQTYQILVDGASGTTGNFMLSWTNNGPFNDDLTKAAVISGFSGAISGSTAFATLEPGEPFHFNDIPGGHSVWFSWTAVDSEYLTMDTFGSGFDTMLALYSGNTIDALTKVADNDDFYEHTTNKLSRLTAYVQAGTAYHIAIDGFGGAYGHYTLNWNASVPLQIGRMNSTNMLLSWPMGNQSFILQACSTMAASNSWTTITNKREFTNGYTQVAVPWQTNRVLFRLKGN